MVTTLLPVFWGSSDLDLGTGLTSGVGSPPCGCGWSLVAEDLEALFSGCLRPFVVPRAPGL